MKMIRQGDVLMVKVETLPKHARQVKKSSDIRDDGLVLAYGEVTGHAHVVVTTKEEPKAQMWSAGAERFIKVLEDTALKHEEHAQIPVDKGVYRVVQQREYEDANQQRFVED